MTVKSAKLLNGLIDDRYSIESKLLQFYISMELIWAFVNTVLSVALRLPKLTILMYGGLFVGLIAFFYIGFWLKLEKFCRETYFVLVFLTIPIMWYLAGGAKTSANILFVAELIVYTMCLRGKKQKIYLAISLLTIPMVQAVSARLPYPVFPMTEGQYQRCGSAIGLTTSLLIASILLKQKQEYVKERDAAVASEKALERSNSMQKNFLANMSHEIRSPLGIVLGFNNLIRDSHNVEHIHEYSRDIEQAGTTLLTVINDILDYSKIESGKLDIIEADYSFLGLMDEVTKDIALKCDEKGLKFVTKLDEKIPASLYGDNIRIKQCLLNVLSNAVKYTEQGVVFFGVRLDRQTENGTYILQYTVKDTGKGISEEAMPNLYSAFQRLDEGMNRGIEGTGLGLAITKNLLDEMNGVIEVESKLGAGTTFNIFIEQKLGSVQVQDVTEAEEENGLEGIRALVVDDTIMNLTLVNKLLTKEGVVVNTIDNGKDCLADVEEHKYDVILLDHMMPEMNGVEVYTRIKEMGGINADTPIIMLTANAMAGAAQEYLDLGFDGYLSKPISTPDMKRLILQLVRRKDN